MSKQEAERLADALCSEPVNSIDAAQRRGHLGSPSEWRNACRLFRARCSPEDASRMARLRAYIEDGLLEVVRPTAPPDQSERIADRLWLWRNWVDGRPEYWAFDNPYPLFMDNDDPQTLGEPCGYAIVKPSRRGRPDVSDEDAAKRIKSDAERIAALEAERSALRTALEFASAAVEDAIYTEDGIDGQDGERLLYIFREALERGTFDKVRYGDLPPMLLEVRNNALEAALEQARVALENVDMAPLVRDALRAIEEVRK